MSSFRLPGPICRVLGTLKIDSGTMARWCSVPPGTIGLVLEAERTVAETTDKTSTISITDSECILMKERLGLPKAPMVDAGVRTTLNFFRNYLGVDPFVEDKEDWIKKYIRGIDFHSPVEDLMISPPLKLSRHKSTSARPKPFAYFTVPGTSQYTTGTSFPASVYELFAVPHPMRCLKSRASGIKFDKDDNVVRSGGGAQYILSSIDASHLTKLA